MGRELGVVGRWLVATGAGVGCCGYLIATVAAGGRHPVWPYYLFAAMAAAGLGLYLLGRAEERERAERSDSARRMSDLGELLSGIAAGRGLTSDDVRVRVQGPWKADDVERYMAGTSLPEWIFIQGFAKAVAGGKWHRVDIERRVRPTWEVAARAGSPAASAHAGGVAGRRVASGVAATAVLVTVGVILGSVLTSSSAQPGGAPRLNEAERGSSSHVPTSSDAPSPSPHLAAAALSTPSTPRSADMPASPDPAGSVSPTSSPSHQAASPDPPTTHAPAQGHASPTPAPAPPGPKSISGTYTFTRQVITCTYSTCGTTPLALTLTCPAAGTCVAYWAYWGSHSATFDGTTIDISFTGTGSINCKGTALPTAVTLDINVLSWTAGQGGAPRTPTQMQGTYTESSPASDLGCPAAGTQQTVSYG